MVPVEHLQGVETMKGGGDTVAIIQSPNLYKLCLRFLDPCWAGSDDC